MLTDRQNPQQIERLIQRQIVRILKEKSTPPDEKVISIRPEHRLGADLGLSSLDLAQLVAGLEIELQADPFQELVPITSVRSVLDLCRAYELFFSGEPAPSAASDALLASQRRAEARRALSTKRKEI